MRDRNDLTLGYAMHVDVAREQIVDAPIAERLLEAFRIA
jgi:hypothetical protein